jgi:outer membrane protein assembly factor BamB
MNPRTLATAYIVLLFTLPSRAGNWPEFRGPTGQGLSTERGLPVKWSATDNVAWKKEIPGKGWSSPVIVDGRVYLTTSVGEGPSLRALCLDAKSGATVWDSEVVNVGSAPRHHAKNTQASPTPIVEGQRVYVHFGHMGTACLDLAGKVLWRNTSLPYPPVHGNGGSPALVDDVLVFSCDGANDPFIAALAKSDGAVRWKVPRSTTAGKRFSFSTPLVITINGRKQIITPGSGGVSALDPKGGSEIWRVRYGEGYSVVPRPVFGHGLVFLSSGFDRANVLAIRPDGKGDVTDTHVAWSVSRSAPKTPSLLLVGDELYAASDDGFGTCLDAKTGRVLWNERLGRAFSASPLHAEGRVYFLGEDGTGVVVKAGTAFEKLAENPLGERTLASYAAADGALFIRGEQHLFRIGLK